MSKNKLHLVVDVLAYLAMACLAATGLVLLYRLPHGSPREGFTLLGLDRHEWGDIHWWVAVATMAVTAMHLVIDWKALKGALRYLVSVHRDRAPGS